MPCAILGPTQYTQNYNFTIVCKLTPKLLDICNLVLNQPKPSWKHIIKAWNQLGISSKTWKKYSLRFSQTWDLLEKKFPFFSVWSLSLTFVTKWYININSKLKLTKTIIIHSRLGSAKVGFIKQTKFSWWKNK